MPGRCFFPKNLEWMIFARWFLIWLLPQDSSPTKLSCADSYVDFCPTIKQAYGSQMLHVQNLYLTSGINLWYMLSIHIPHTHTHGASGIGFDFLKLNLRLYWLFFCFKKNTSDIRILEISSGKSPPSKLTPDANKNQVVNVDFTPRKKTNQWQWKTNHLKIYLENGDFPLPC